MNDRQYVLWILYIFAVVEIVVISSIYINHYRIKENKQTQKDRITCISSLPHCYNIYEKHGSTCTKWSMCIYQGPLLLH